MSTVKLSGFKELSKALERLPKATGKNVLRRVAKGALEPMANDAAAKAPDATGKLSFSIIVSDKRTKRVKKRLNSRDGISMAMGPSTGLGVLQYASFVEFGTVDTPAFGFMRSTWDSGAEGALTYVEVNLGNEITKSAAKLAKKRARAGR